MSTEIVTRVVTVNFQEETLTEINELSNHLTRAGFTLVLNDENGKVHELGTNTFGLISAQSADEVKALRPDWRKRRWVAPSTLPSPHLLSG